MITPVDAPLRELTRSDDSAAHAATATAFDPLVSAAVDVHARQQVARDIATANRHAGLDRQLLEADLRVLDAEVRSREDLRAVDVSLAELGLGPAAGMFKTAAPNAAQLADEAAPTGAAPEEASRVPAQRHDPRAAGRLQASGSQAEVSTLADAPTPGAGTTARHATIDITPRAPAAGHGRLPAPVGLSGSAPQAVAALQGGMANGHGRGTGGGTQHGQVAAGEAARALKTRHARPAFTVQRGAVPQSAQRKTIDSVMKILQSRHTPGHSVVRLRLTPPELGTLTVDIKLQRDAMTLRFETHSAAVRDLLHGHAAELADALRVQGLHLDGFEIEVTPEPDPHTGSATGDERSQHTDAFPSHGQDADARDESPDADDPDAALAEAVDQALLAAGRVDIRA